MAPGLLVNVHVPLAGNEFNTTLPVAEAHVGWVIVPMVGLVGIAIAALIVTLAEGTDVHPEGIVTAYVYIPLASPVIVVLDPEPVLIVPKGVLVNVQVPDAGNPFNTTLPVDVEQFGCVTVPTIGAVGADPG